MPRICTAKLGIVLVESELRIKMPSMAAAFGSGVLFSLVSAMRSPNQAANVITSGLFFALVQVGPKVQYTPPEEDLFYARTKNMLSSLGLQQYEKNFKKGLLTSAPFNR